MAKEAKVGIGTVSRVFNDHPSVSEETKKRVLRVATRLNYHPHPYARGLARKRTNSILAMIPFFSTFFFVEVLQGVQSKLSESDFDLILYGLVHPDHAETSLRKHTLRRRGDGILFFSMHMPEEFVEEYLRQKIPVVLIDTHNKNFDSFFVDNSEGAYVATNHLISLGHERIGILLANLESTPARQRLEGFRRAMNEANLEVRSSWIKRSSSAKLDGFTRETGYELMREFLVSRFDMPTAVFVSSDIQAAGALSAIEEAGMKCPDDIALVGFDDIELASHLGLTTMRQPMFEMGSLAAARLIERMANLTLKPKETAFVPKLVVRQTTVQLQKQQSIA
ncbi:MAG TPA: LacI family DNA-binding transcriptional regulator [Bacteroidota bacterium]|nr:LacI family DNA-binding transcriptional regulator [Bacteroidota bacterium]